jgi:hypothetical protein
MLIRSTTISVAALAAGLSLVSECNKRLKG